MRHETWMGGRKSLKLEEICSEGFHADRMGVNVKVEPFVRGCLHCCLSWRGREPCNEIAEISRGNSRGGNTRKGSNRS